MLFHLSILVVSILWALPVQARSRYPYEVRAYVPLNHTRGKEDALRVIDVNSGLPLYDIPLPPGPPMDVAALADGSRIYITDQDNDRVLCLETWTDMFVDTLAVSSAYRLGVNEQGTLLAAASADSVWLFEMPSGRLRWRRQSPVAVSRIFFPPSTSRVLLMRDECFVVDLETGAFLESVPLPGAPRGIAYSRVTGKLYIATLETLLAMDPDALEEEPVRLLPAEATDEILPRSIWVSPWRDDAVIRTESAGTLSLDLRAETFTEIRLTNLTGMSVPPPPSCLAVGPGGGEYYSTTPQAFLVKQAVPWWEPWWDPFIPTFVIASASTGEIRAIIPLPTSATDLLTVTRPVRQPADFNYDRFVDFGDFLDFASAYGTSTGGARWNYLADLDLDGHVDFDDFLVFAEVFGDSY